MKEWARFGAVIFSSTTYKSYICLHPFQVRVHIETTHAHGSQIKLHLVDNQPYIPHIEETPTTHSKHQLIQVTGGMI